MNDKEQVIEGTVIIAVVEIIAKYILPLALQIIKDMHNEGMSVEDILKLKDTIIDPDKKE